jgi:CHAT domain-containing protein/zinc ribbon protein
MQYRKMDVELYDYTDAGEKKFRVRVVSSPVDKQEQTPADAEEVTIPGDLSIQLRLLEERQLDAEEIRKLGETLGMMLYPNKMQSFIEDALDRIGKDVGLRIQLKIDSYILADLPWEYAWLPDVGFLALDKRLSIARHESKAIRMNNFNPVSEAPPRLVTLMADPAVMPQYPPLKLDEEEKKIRDALEPIKEQLRADFFPETTIQVIQDALIGGTHVFHFSGHGEFEKTTGSEFQQIAGEGYIVILDDDGKRTPLRLSVEKLVMLLKNTQVRLAVLGACESGRRGGESAWTGIATALAKAQVPAVVGMQYKILDSNAAYFSRGFYRNLAEHQSIDMAVTAGRQNISLRSSDPKERDWGVPVLYLRADESEGVIFPKMKPIESTGGGTDLDLMRRTLASMLNVWRPGPEGSYEVPPRQSNSSKKCPTCGADNPEVAQYCLNCGKKLGSAPV